MRLAANPSIGGAKFLRLAEGEVKSKIMRLAQRFLKVVL